MRGLWWVAASSIALAVATNAESDGLSRALNELAEQRDYALVGEALGLLHEPRVVSWLVYTLMLARLADEGDDRLILELPKVTDVTSTACKAAPRSASDSVSQLIERDFRGAIQCGTAIQEMLDTMARVGRLTSEEATLVRQAGNKVGRSVEVLRTLAIRRATRGSELLRLTNATASGSNDGQKP